MAKRVPRSEDHLDSQRAKKEPQGQVVYDAPHLVEVAFSDSTLTRVDWSHQVGWTITAVRMNHEQKYVTITVTKDGVSKRLRVRP